MNDKEVIGVFAELLKKDVLTEKEVEAVREAIGILSWAKLMEGYVNRKKAKRDRDLNS